MAGMQIPAVAQVLGKDEVAPAGTVVYSLPSTTLVMKVTAEHESYQAGPYAQFAKKYLGLDVRQTSGDTYKIKSIEMVPYIEADPEVSAAVNLQGSKVGTANFLNMCSQGLIVLSDNYTGKGAQWRFPSMQGAQEFVSGAASNIDNVTTTLYNWVYNGLVFADGKCVVTPDLAESYELSPDGLSYVFQIRQDVKFHNGDQMTALMDQRRQHNACHKPQRKQQEHQRQHQKEAAVCLNPPQGSSLPHTAPLRHTAPPLPPHISIRAPDCPRTTAGRQPCIPPQPPISIRVSDPPRSISDSP